MTRRQQFLLACAGTVFLTAAVVALYRARDRFMPDPSARVTPEDEALSEDDGPDSAKGIDFDSRANRVTRKDGSGNTLWSTPLDGRLGGAPHVQADEARAYVTHADGVTALDVNTGTVLWHSPGPTNGLLVSGPLLFATGHGGEKAADSERWVTARDVASGQEAFRVELPAKFEALAVAEMAGLIVVQNDEAGRETALLLDRTGRVVHRFDRQVVAAYPLAGGDRLILTSRDVVRLSEAGDVKWSAPFEGEEWIAGGGFVALPDGDVAAFLYGRISDSGVQLVHLDPATGTRRRVAYCKQLGTIHSAYRHTAVVKLVGDRLRVTSRGSHGTFVEVLDAQDGRSVGRDQRKR